MIDRTVANKKASHFVIASIRHQTIGLDVSINKIGKSVLMDLLELGGMDGGIDINPTRSSRVQRASKYSVLGTG